MQILLPLCNPLAIILLLASGVSAALGDPIGAAIIVVIVLAGAIINFVQTFRSQCAIERLRETITPTATVLRDGQWQEIDRREIVPDDVIRLCAAISCRPTPACSKPATCTCSRPRSTGESMPVEKQPATLNSAGPDADDDLVFFGTSVVSGTGTAVVLKTGGATTFGEMPARLAARPPATEFDRHRHALRFSRSCKPCCFSSWPSFWPTFCSIATRCNRSSSRWPWQWG